MKTKLNWARSILALMLVILPAMILNAAPKATTTTTKSEFSLAGMSVPDRAECGLSIVVTEGNLVATSRVTMDGNGGFHSAETFTVRASGVDQTGTKYQIQGSDAASFIATAGGTQVFRSTVRFMAIGQGKAVNAIMRAHVHTTVNANGDATHVIESTTTECK
jgi:hypothetical protein